MLWLPSPAYGRPAGWTALDESQPFNTALSINESGQGAGRLNGNAWAVAPRPRPRLRPAGGQSLSPRVALPRRSMRPDRSRGRPRSPAAYRSFTCRLRRTGGRQATTSSPGPTRVGTLQRVRQCPQRPRTGCRYLDLLRRRWSSFERELPVGAGSRPHSWLAGGTCLTADPRNRHQQRGSRPWRRVRLGPGDKRRHATPGPGRPGHRLGNPHRRCPERCRPDRRSRADQRPRARLPAHARARAGCSVARRPRGRGCPTPR